MLHTVPCTPLRSLGCTVYSVETSKRPEEPPMTTTQTTRKPVLTATARTALGDALKDGNRHILNMNAPGWTKVVEELEPLGMITVTRSLRYGGAQPRELPPAGRAGRLAALR